MRYQFGAYSEDEQLRFVSDNLDNLEQNCARMIGGKIDRTDHYVGLEVAGSEIVSVILQKENGYKPLYFIVKNPKLPSVM